MFTRSVAIVIVSLFVIACDAPQLGGPDLSVDTGVNTDVDDFDRSPFEADTDVGEETGDAGMDGVEVLPDMGDDTEGLPLSACCQCIDGESICEAPKLDGSCVNGELTYAGCELVDDHVECPVC
jgi:hypothetical protein